MGENLVMVEDKPVGTKSFALIGPSVSAARVLRGIAASNWLPLARAVRSSSKTLFKAQAMFVLAGCRHGQSDASPAECP